MVKVAKTEQTIQLEREIWEATHKQGVFCCFEVTIGWFGDERVDYLTYDTKGVWRGYEIKASKADFHSKAHNTFIGHYNYYVLPQELYEQVKDEIPEHIGVYCGSSCIKKSKKQALLVDEQVLKDSFIRCLYREVEKVIKSGSPTYVDITKRHIARLNREVKEYKRKYHELTKTLIRSQDKYGIRWWKEG